MEFALKPHPDFPSAAVTAVTVRAWREVGALHLGYRVSGGLDRVKWPAPAKPRRADELWRHTCFEAFVQTDGNAAYREINLAPSGPWAVYKFDARRNGMCAAAATVETVWQKPELVAKIDRAGSAEDSWRVGLSAVIEATDGTKSYWALAHGDGPPDFHNPDCFIATLPAPDAP